MSINPLRPETFVQRAGYTLRSMGAQRQTVLIEFSYLGNYYYGLQPQPGLRTVGQALRERLEHALGAAPSGLVFAARTDSGVSAEQNFASAWFRGVVDLQTKLSGLCSPECSALRVLRAWPVSRSMNARNCAQSKRYQYCISYDPTDSPRAWHIVPALDLPAMQAAANCLLGTHNFRAFRGPNCSSKNPVKHLFSIQVRRQGSSILIDVEGNAFLRHMVRILVGTLAEVGAGLRPWQDVPQILASQQRRYAGLTAPAQGLTLKRVELRWPGQRHPGLPLLRPQAP